jgi:hypothetical protein
MRDSFATLDAGFLTLQEGPRILTPLSQRRCAACNGLFMLWIYCNDLQGLMTCEDADIAVERTHSRSELAHGRLSQSGRILYNC